MVKNEATPSQPWKPRDGISPDAVPRPVAALAWEFDSGHRIPNHFHRKAQLVFASQGVMTVTTEVGSWVVPPQRAVFVPGGTRHEIAMSGGVSMRTLYLSDAAVRRLPAQCFVVSVSPLLRELVLRVIELDPLYAESGPDARLVAVLLDEIEAMHVAPLHLPLCDEPRTRRVIDGLLADPSDARGLEDWARVAGASARTLARSFERETGLRFGVWRQQLRLLRSLELLALGHSVTNVASSLGYESPSAFISMFRRSLGATPKRYFDRKGSESEGAVRGISSLRRR